MLWHSILAANVVVLVGLSGHLPAAAQGSTADQMTTQELETLFNKQKTRGLVLAPTGGTDSDTTEAAAETAAADKTYVELAPEDQVNVQIRFDFDSAALRDDQKPKLATLCQALKTVDIQLFRIVGHTDAAGSASYNETLSLLRAQEVKRHLVNECGITAERLEAVGVGEQFPLDKDNPRNDVNRRVEFQALS